MPDRISDNPGHPSMKSYGEAVPCLFTELQRPPLHFPLRESGARFHGKPRFQYFITIQRILQLCFSASKHLQTPSVPEQFQTIQRPPGIRIQKAGANRTFHIKFIINLVVSYN